MEASTAVLEVPLAFPGALSVEALKLAAIQAMTLPAIEDLFVLIVVPVSGMVSALVSDQNSLGHIFRCIHQNYSYSSRSNYCPISDTSLWPHRAGEDY